MSKSSENYALRRELLIKSNKETAELDSQITAFITRLTKNPDSIDEDFKKEMYIKAITQLQHQVVKEQENIQMETGFLKNGPAPRPDPRSLPPPRKPMILTKNAMQAKVFGAGYPSVPT